jgi:hypothetical protein
MSFDKVLVQYKPRDASSGARGFLFDGNLTPCLIVPIDNLWRPMSTTV